jgi:NAD(P)-dependent dehydrogenase (short-subunit alcohol dehydrogenase family)
MTEQFRLDDKIALVTGGSKGIGFGIADALAQAGADVVLVARNEADLENAKNSLSQTDRRIWSYSFDMSAVEKIDEMFAGVVQDTGGIDILVNNAGGTRRGPAETLTTEDWNFVINLNMTAAFTLCQAFARQRIKTGKKGKIINIASLMSETVREDNAPYAASKGGIRQMTKALAPWGRWGSPEDLGYAAVYLAAPASDYVTGHVLYVDGGMLSTFGPSSW